MPTLIDLIAENITAYPERTAAKCGTQRISYDELGKSVDCFTRFLLAQDYDHNALVAVMMERSLDMLVALLGIMKAGYGYLPVDPSFPSERINYMLEHSKVNAIVSDNKLIDSVIRSGVSLPSTLNFLDISDVLKQQSAAQQVVENHAQDSDLAYVIYTSGSTGLPKGVMIPHRAVYNLLKSVAKRPGFSSDDTLAAVTTLSFDISVLELFLPLSQGGCVEIVSKAVATDGEQLAGLLERENITVMQATPSTWKMLLDAGWQGNKSLKVLVGGEAPPKEVIEKLISKCGEVWNMYGPTETTVWSSCSNITSAENITIGQALEYTQLYILDDDMLPVSQGAEGLLYIGGRGLARGYLFRDDLTDEKFVENINKPGERIYNTGDVVYARNDGSIEYLRRADNQIKLRGFRIELGEIETRLNEVDGVSQSVVTLREDKEVSELLAYISTSGKTTLTVAHIRASLKQHLPDYMIPNGFILLDDMPLTPNGKIDRKNLPLPTESQFLTSQDYLAPRNEVEQQVAEIWQEILEIDKISVDADFYELGGHSLLVTRIWARLKKKFGCALELSQVFKSSTIAKLAVEIQSLTDEKAGQYNIPVISRMKSPIMSIEQQRFWYIDQVAQHKSLYNLCSAFMFKGKLSHELLLESLNIIVQRHEILRTALDWSGDIPKQKISKKLILELPVEDLSTLAVSEKQHVLMQKLGEKIHEKIELDSVPLFKISLLKIDEHQHVLFFMPHHVIWDGWSFDIFLSEIKICYEALNQGIEPKLLELPIQYADFSHWQRQYFQGDALNTQLDYWREQLSGELPVLNLPIDNIRPSEFSYNGKSESIDFEPELVAGINDLAKINGTTVNMLLLAMYFILLNRYTGQDDIIIGSPIQGRLSTETENMIGLFVNTLPIRIKLEPSLSFVEVLERVKQVAMDAYQNQEIPFERLVEDLSVERDISRTPIFQTLFTFQEVSGRDYKIADIELQQINLHNGTCPTDISYWVKSSPAEITGAIEYNPDLFGSEKIRLMIGHIKQLTSSILANPQLAIKLLDILTVEEMTRLLVENNSTENKFVHYDSVAQLIDAQVDRTPEAVAVGFEGKELSYQELDRRANQLAHHLQSLGVGPDVLVGVSLQRSEQMLVAVLGVLKAGGAYVPMDPEYPKERLAYMLEHSAAPVLISENELLEQLPEHQASVVCIDSDWGSISQCNADRPETNLQPEHLAYVIYTSGSTGKPKGVQVQHGAVVNFLVSMAQQPGLSAEDVLLAVTTLSFDIAVLELYLPLTVGGRVEIASSEVVSDGEQLLSKLKQASVTVLQATPATWRMLLSAGWEGGEGFKVLIGGEAVPRDLANELIDRVGGVWNMYGPTETTVWSTCEYVTEKEGPIMIGRPIGNTQVYVLDEYQQLLPVGVPGELHIGGAGVVRGYLNAPEMTEERFIHDPFANDPQARMYRTGDQVRYHRDGRLEYLTRLDSQVKIRGFRIELGEIETALLTHPVVKQGVVTIREDRPGDVRLVAYVVAEPGQDVTMTEVRKHLRNGLPEYMIPQHVVELDEMPMTPNGKIDRKVLPAPFGGVAVEEETYVAPRTEMEQELAKVWQEMLGVERVGMHDNFFDLGGHSLLSMQVIALIRDRFDMKLTPRAMLLNNLEQLAQQCGDTVSDGIQIDEAGNEKDSVSVRFLDKIKTKIRM